MSVAASDPVLQSAGLIGETIKNVREFFELSDQDIHRFSCDCGGTISNDVMAKRIRNLA
jgi:hypothetical protein